MSEVEKTIKIFVRLLGEGGTEVFRPTESIQLSHDTYKLLPCKDYDPEDEIWEFLPGTIVRGRLVRSVKGGEFLMAIAPHDAD